jgi:hypothetical protein
VEVVFLELGGKPLAKSSIDEWQRKAVPWREAADGRPTEYALYANKVVFYPTPDATVATQIPVIRYVAKPPSIALYGVGSLSSAYHRIVVYWAVYLFSGCYPDSAVASTRGATCREAFQSELEASGVEFAMKGVTR